MSLPPSRPGPPDWARIDRGLCEAYSLTPVGIDALTLPEIMVLSLPARGKGSPPPGSQDMSDAELSAYIARQQAMTPMQRLEGMRRDRRG